MNTELTALYQYESHRFENGRGVIIIGQAMTEAGDRITVKGPMDDDEPDEGLTYRFYGHWANYTNRRTGVTERQFHFSTCIQSEPAGQRGIISYLQRAPGIGGITATKIHEQYGSESVAILKSDPASVAAKISRLGQEKAAAASAWLKANERLERVHIDLIGVLDGRGFPKGLPKALIKEWGNRAAEIVRNNPYALMRFRGCGFKLTDSLYLALGHPPDSLKRQALCVWYTLASDTSGHIWRGRQAIADVIAGNIGGTVARVGDAIRLAVRAGLIVQKWTDGHDGLPTWDGSVEWLADAKRAGQEVTISRCLAGAASDIPQWPTY